ncbi:polysaccharide biosynthesis protein [Sphingobacterium corticibacter]|uniref:Polysaccharide biosynthesis protein n=1 Tax=Sphingobacterium corticibacter TaxID=2171749 RepID=A0A2T8HJD9_9SPHI|nr:nucleoside-diphosphate sugar epimerase/dehydratase [Sphingobacterium corticibacter]PVH25564.1 polysaccharide biosynthesis protein [Sphingobacterium corticibacter]
MAILSIAKRFRKDNPRWVILLIDIMIVLFCYYFSSYVINSSKGRFDFELMFQKSLTVTFTYTLSFIFYRTYRGIVRQAGIQDAARIMIATFSALGVLMLISLIARNTLQREELLGQYFRLSYAVVFMHAFLATVALVAARVFYRTIYESLFLHGRKLTRVLIFGAGNMGGITLNILRSDIKQKYKVVAFADDSPSRIGKMIHGYKILSINQLSENSLQSMNVDEVIIALDDNNQERLNHITQVIESWEVKIKILPSSAKMLHGQIAVNQLRPLQIADLLGRAAIQLDNPIVAEALSNRVVLVTGGAGSIGSELVRQIAINTEAKLIVLDQAESPLYDLQQELKHLISVDSAFIVGNVRDRKFMESVFKKYKPEVVFHAAAYKHVPLMEHNPYESVRTNVHGTKIVADLASAYGVDKFVMISTDKAVNPTNVMGATKRIAEIYVSALNGLSATNYIVTRFGNVLGSNGSVIPLFEKQLKNGGPLTVTHHDITRYFMTIPEACQLVQEAAIMGKGGEVFVFDMGKPVRITDLAKRMIRLKGYRYPEDIQIKYTGLRPGEKIYEELLASDENTIQTHHKKIMIALVNSEDAQKSMMQIDNLCTFVRDADPEMDQMDLVRRVKALVPEFTSQNSKFMDLDGPDAQNKTAQKH